MGAGTRICTAAAVALLGVPAAAEAARVEVHNPCSPETAKYGCIPHLVYRAADGEANVVRRDVTGDESTRSAIRDDGAPLEAGDGCTQLSPNEVLCPSFHMSVLAGDGDDHVATEKAVVYLGPGNDRLDGEGVNGADGGPGDDVMIGGAGHLSRAGNEGDDRIEVGGGDAGITGGPGNDTIVSGSGPDRLSGDAGHDTISAGEGNDRLTGYDFSPDGETPAGDRLDGGGGRDIVTYVHRAAPVRVDLSDGAPDGAPGEDDLLTDIEDVAGGHGADLLTGDGGANTLLGGPGDDQLRGAGGDDLLEGGEGFDEFDGGDGNDVFDSFLRGRWWGETGDSSRQGHEPDRGKEPVVCGGGTDEVEYTFADLLDRSCERVVLYLYPRRHTVAAPKVGGASATFTLPCTKSLRIGGRCAGAVRLGAGPTATGRRFDLPSAGGRVRVPLPGGRRPDRLRIQLVYDGKPAGIQPKRTWIAVLD